MPLIIELSEATRSTESKKFTENHKRAYKKLLTQLCNTGLTQGANLEKLHASQLYSLRLNQKARVLVLPVKVNGQLTWCIMDFLLNHRYSRVKRYSKKSIEQYLKMHQTAIDAFTASMEPDDILKLNTPMPYQSDTPIGGAGAGAGVKRNDTTYNASISVREACLYDGAVIELSPTQDGCLNGLATGLLNESFAALVAGAPGSGKTLLALQLIKRLVIDSSTSDDKPINIYYLAESKALRDAINEQWQSSVEYESTRSTGTQVKFFNYECLLQISGCVAELSSVNDSGLRELFEEEKKVLKQTTKGQIFTEFNRISFDQFCQECIVMSVLNAVTEYQVAGSNHSLFHGKPEIQQLLWNVFDKYKEILVQGNSYDAKLSCFNCKSKLEGITIIVDEALDLSRAQLFTLMNIGVKIVFMGDYNQDLMHISHSMEFLRLMIEGQSKTKGLPSYIAKLNKTYRCPKGVVSVANQLLTLKNIITSHGSYMVDTKIESSLESHGSVICISNTKKEEGQLKAFCTSTDTAVICLPSNKDTAVKVLATPLIFSVEQIKGLGYQRVILWNLISVKVAKRLLKVSRSGKLKRDLLSIEEKSLVDALNHLFTAITRSEQELVFVQANASHPSIKEFLNFLTADITKSNLLSKADRNNHTASTKEEWLDEAARLRRAGKEQHANAIERQYNSTPENDVTEINAEDDAGASEEKRTDKKLNDQQPAKNSNEIVDDDFKITFCIETVVKSNKSNLRKKRGRRKKRSVAIVKTKKKFITVDFINLDACSINLLLDLPEIEIKKFRNSDKLFNVQESEFNKIKLKHIFSMLMADTGTFGIEKFSNNDANKFIPFLIIVEELFFNFDGNIPDGLEVQGKRYGSLICKLIVTVVGRKYLLQELHTVLFAIARKQAGLADLFAKCISESKSFQDFVCNKLCVGFDNPAINAVFSLAEQYECIRKEVIKAIENEFNKRFLKTKGESGPTLMELVARNQQALLQLLTICSDTEIEDLMADAILDKAAQGSNILYHIISRCEIIATKLLRAARNSEKLRTVIYSQLLNKKSNDGIPLVVYVFFHGSENFMSEYIQQAYLYASVRDTLIKVINLINPRDNNASVLFTAAACSPESLMLFIDASDRCPDIRNAFINAMIKYSDNDTQTTVLHCIAEFEKFEIDIFEKIFSNAKSSETVRGLIAKGFNLPDLNGRTPFHLISNRSRLHPICKRSRRIMFELYRLAFSYKDIAYVLLRGFCEKHSDSPMLLSMISKELVKKLLSLFTIYPDLQTTLSEEYGIIMQRFFQFPRSLSKILLGSTVWKKTVSPSEETEPPEAMISADKPCSSLN